MVSNAAKKNILLTKRFGLFKSFIIRCHQRYIFIKNTRIKIIEINNTSSAREKITKIKILLNYLYNTLDIWVENNILRDAFKSKTIEFASLKPLLFNKYLLIFGYNCPYTKNDGNICYENILSNKFCDCHKKMISDINSEILLSLSDFPKDICNIVFKFI